MNAPDEMAAAAANSPPPAPAAPAPNPARRIFIIAFAMLVGVLAYKVIADRLTPYTAQAAVDVPLAQIAAEVNGEVVALKVQDNAFVKKGQVLFLIDPEPFQIALKTAEANLAVALQNAQVSELDINYAKADLDKQRTNLSTSRELGTIVLDLAKKNAVSETSAIRARSDMQISSVDVVRAQVELERAKGRLGDSGYDNAKVKQALAALEQAKLDLKNTTAFAPADGVITNLRLRPGQFVSRGAPLLSFIANGPRWITAAMRENQLGNIQRGDRVLVAFDEQPGHLFEGSVDSVGWGVAQGGEAPNGQLPDLTAPAGWLREPQRFPVRVVLAPVPKDEEVQPPQSQRRAGERGRVHRPPLPVQSAGAPVAARGGTGQLPAMSAPRQRPVLDEAALVRRDAIMRFAVGVSLGFVLCEAMGWGPTALAPVLAGVLLANLPGRPNFKLAVVIIGAMVVSSLFVWVVSVLLADVPTALFLGVAIMLFATYLSMLRGAPALPAILMLVSLATIPVITMAYPQQAGALPQKLINSILLALVITWAVYLPWPRPPPQAPKAPKAPGPDPVAAALVATVIVMPVMLIYLMYSPVQAMPVMIATVMLVTNFDEHRSTRDAVARVVHNALGAALGVFSYWTLLVAPSLITLALISFLIALWFGARIAKGGPSAYNAVLATTACFVIFSSAIASGPTAAGLWLPRVIYFAIAGLFVVSAMQLLWGRFVSRPQAQPA